MLAFVTFFRSRHRVSSSFRSCPSSYVRCLASDSPKLKPLAHFRITGIIPPFVGDWPFRLSMAGGPPVAFSNFHYSSGAPSVRAADRWERGCSRYHFTRHSGRAHLQMGRKTPRRRRLPLCRRPKRWPQAEAPELPSCPARSISPAPNTTCMWRLSGQPRRRCRLLAGSAPFDRCPEIPPTARDPGPEDPGRNCLQRGA